MILSSLVCLEKLATVALSKAQGRLLDSLLAFFSHLLLLFTEYEVDWLVAF